MEMAISTGHPEKLMMGFGTNQGESRLVGN